MSVGSVLDEYEDRLDGVETAEEAQQFARQILGGVSEEIPPSEQERLESTGLFESLDEEMSEEGPTRKMAIEVYDLSEPAERHRMESFLDREGVRVVGTAWRGESLTYMVTMQLTPPTYRILREPFMEPSEEAPKESSEGAPEENSQKASCNSSSCEGGVFERIGRRMDRWMSQLRRWSVGSLL